MLKIDNDFKNLLPQLTDNEYEGLQNDILEHGILSPIILWGETIVDGHNRYEIALANKIPESDIPTKKIIFQNKAEAFKWIINHQGNRRNLTKSQLVAAWSKYEEERAKEAKERKKGGQGGVLLSKNFNEANEPIRTAAEVAEKIGVSEPTYRDMKLITEKGTQEQIERMDRGGKGNSVSAIAREIKKDTGELIKCSICGEMYPPHCFYKGRTDCKYCHNKRSMKQKKKIIYDVKGGIIKDKGIYKDVTSDEIIGNMYTNNVQISINDIMDEFNINLETYIENLEAILKTHLDIVSANKEVVRTMWNNGVLKFNKMMEAYT